MNVPELLILGNINLDLILGTLDAWPERGTEALVRSQTWRVGGNAGNAVVAAQALGTHFRAVSTVGDDLAGHWLRQQLGHSVQWHPTPDSTSLTVAFSHTDGERTFVTQLGHLARLRKDDLKLQETGGTPYVLLAGAFLTPELRKEYPAILKELKEAGSLVALDMGWPDGGFSPELRTEVQSWLPEVDYLLINELEASELSGEAQVGNGPEGAIRKLLQHMALSGVIAVKCGSRGVMIGDRRGVFGVPAPQVEVIDSVGAGDTWNAAFLHALIRRLPLQEAAAFAVKVASQAISTSPRRFVLPQDLR